MNTFKKRQTFVDVMDEQIVEIPLYKTSGRPGKDQKPDYFSYRIEGNFAA